MSRNKDRLGLEGEEILEMDENPPAAAITAQTGGGFSWATPTEMINLPSAGKFYPPGHPLHNSSNIEIKYMTAKEEDILTSRSLVKAGVAIDRVLENLIVDKSININSLLVGDKNALIIAARVTGYGNIYETKVTCPSCQEQNEYAFDLDDGIVSDPSSALEDYNATLTDRNTFLLETPMTKAQVEVRLLTGEDEMMLFKKAQRNAKKKLNDSTLTDQFRAFIVSVNGSDDVMTVASFVNAMPARDSRFLRTFYAAASPNIDLTQTFECSSCGYSADMEVPLTIDFFWPK
tara:strand:- start:5933 stop:6802 length:870 start_codon:yes stop_codon:yes gene_type:complete